MGASAPLFAENITWLLTPYKPGQSVTTGEMKEEMMNIIVNGISKEWPDGKPLSFENAAELSGLRADGLTIVYRRGGMVDHRDGILTEAGTIEVMEGTIISAAHTGNA